MKVLQLTDITRDNLLSLLQGMETECVAEILIDEGSPDSLIIRVNKTAIEAAKKALQAFSQSKFSIIVSTTKVRDCSTGVNAPDIAVDNWTAMSLNDRGSMILKEIRRQLSWSIDQAAQQIGVTVSGWYYVEQGKRRIGRGMASKIRENLNLSPKLDSMLRDATTDR